MKPTTIWTAIVFLALGVCGVLDAAGVVSSSQTIGLWWPVAIVGWAATAMWTERRTTLGGIVGVAAGLALLADIQAWASDALVWSLLAITVGAAILVDAVIHRSEGPNGSPSSPATGGLS